MPVTFPLDGDTVWSNGRIGPVTGRLHQDEEFHRLYLQRLRYELTHAFSERTLIPRIDRLQSLLLRDLEWLEETLDARRDDLRSQIRQSYQDIRDYIVQRREYLDGVLPTGVRDWELY
jgi:hypothetical protein